MTQPPFSPAVLTHRHDGWTAERQQRFINVLATTGSVVRAAQAVAMSPRSAHRLRRHPMAGEFRAAWDAALQQVWGSLDQVALDRAVNGEVETIERSGYGFVERRRPCSDRLLIYLLNRRERAAAAARAERAEAHQRAMAEYRLAEIHARAELASRRGAKARAAAPEMPVKPQMLDDAAADTAALHALSATIDGLGPWPEMDEGFLMYDVAAEAQGLEPEAAAEVSESDLSAAQIAEYESRPRWEDYRDAETDAEGAAKVSR